MGSAQAEHILVIMTVASLERIARRTEEDGGGKGVERKSVYRENTHETKVALLVEVTDGGGRLSTGLEEVEDAEAPLSRLEYVRKYSDGRVRSWELLPGVFGRLAERKAGDGAEWFRSSLRECFDKEESK
jgi:hypothetical protein